MPKKKYFQILGKKPEIVALSLLQGAEHAVQN